MFYSFRLSSPVGPLVLASAGDSLAGLWLEGQKYFGGSVPGPWLEQADLPVFRQTRAWLERYFDGARPDPGELPLAPAGSPFRQAVWELLRQIPYGRTTTYGDLARELTGRRDGRAVSPQAVGGAVGHNPISIIIPCHRVVGADGSLTGYAGGLAVKTRLLALEGALPPSPAQGPRRQLPPIQTVPE